jgi:hypothetical protein
MSTALVPQPEGNAKMKILIQEGTEVVSMPNQMHSPLRQMTVLVPFSLEWPPLHSHNLCLVWRSTCSPLHLHLHISPHFHSTPLCLPLHLYLPHYITHNYDKNHLLFIFLSYITK